MRSIDEVGGIKYVPVSPSERTCDAIDCVYDTSAENITIGESVTNKGVSLIIRKLQPYVCYSNTNIKSGKTRFMVVYFLYLVAGSVPLYEKYFPSH